ncbi:hypothetical protein ES703_47434 [subsurface metagenome]
MHGGHPLWIVRAIQAKVEFRNLTRPIHQILHGRQLKDYGVIAHDAGLFKRACHDELTTAKPDGIPRFFAQRLSRSLSHEDASWLPQVGQVSLVQAQGLPQVTAWGPTCDQRGVTRLQCHQIDKLTGHGSDAIYPAQLIGNTFIDGSSQ